MDITPLVPKGLLVIEAYGDGGFRVSGVRHEGSVLILPEGAKAWPVATLDDITSESLQPVLASSDTIDILFLGSGQRATMLPEGLRQAFREVGIAVEAMDTGAACRTYNVLLAEGRRVAAALIAVSR